METGVQLYQDDYIRVNRKGRFVVVKLRSPHDVVSTCRVNGGMRSDLTHLVNHQSCEAAGHAERAHEIVKMGQTAYHHTVCKDLSISGGTAATMGTAANMQYASLQHAEFEEFRVSALVTAGVEGNAGCAGDLANWVERQQSYENVAPKGTINTMVFFNVPLSAAALTRTAATMTEAKSAVLSELAVRSRCSGERATGTGTDQFCIAAPAGEAQITWTGKHSKVGELIGKAVRAATREALLWQNGLEPSRARNIHRALGHLGFTAEFFEQRLSEVVDDEELTFIKRNMLGIVHDPQLAAGAFMIAELSDRITYGTISDHVGREQMLSQAALTAASLATNPDCFPEMLRQLRPWEHAEVKELIFQAFLLGWRQKWHT